MNCCALRSLLLMLVLTAVCSAGVVTLDFENITPYPSGDVFVQNYYNGGTSGIGTSGPNYGVSFDAPALVLCLNSLTVSCSNTSHGGLGIPTSQDAGLYFLTNDAITMDVAAGFDTGFSFDYTAINEGGSVSVYDGVGGTGNLLTTFNLAVTPSGPCPGYGAGFCPFFPVGVSFNGIAQSVVFAGVGNQIVFDDITFGSATPGDVPEPATFGLIGLGLTVLGLAGRRRITKS